MAAAAMSELLEGKEFYRTKAGKSPNSIEATPVPPKIIDDLIDNKLFRRKFNFLIRKGHLQDLLDLAELAQDRDTPSRWFAKATRTKPVPGEENRPTYWERSLKYLAKLRKVRRMASEVADRIKAPADRMKLVYKAVWRHGERAVQMAVTAAETAVTKKRPDGSPFKLFCHLASKRPGSPAMA